MSDTNSSQESKTNGDISRVNDTIESSNELNIVSTRFDNNKGKLSSKIKYTFFKSDKFELRIITRRMLYQTIYVPCLSLTLRIDINALTYDNRK